METRDSSDRAGLNIVKHSCEMRLISITHKELSKLMLEVIPHVILKWINQLNTYTLSRI
jgi:hypothetical protein